MKKRGRMKSGKKILIFFVITVTLWIFGFYLYITYKNIEITPGSYETSRLSTKEEQIVDNAQEKSKTIADVIEETTRKVVGISKLKEPGISILSKTTESELGLGTGMIVSDNGYILSNEHVAGQKYSKCYITLENGNNYDGTVVWSDSDLDLAIIKINAKNLEYISLGDSNEIRVGETVYTIRKPNSAMNLEGL